MDIIQQPGGCLQLRHNQDELSKPYLLISDVHFDSPHCDRKMLQRHLNEAVDRNAGIMVFGDYFDSMQGRRDKRGNKGDLREEYKVSNYLDKLVDLSTEFLEPYKNNIILMSMGNHESAYLQHLETDLLGRLIQQLDVPHIQHGGYQGFVRFQHLVTSTSKRTTTLFYHHGNWGGVVNRGTQSTARFASITPDADIVVTGHTHSRWLMPHAQFKLTQNGTTEVVSQMHVKVGGYKEEFSKGSGWATEKLVMPGDLGGWWLTFSFQDEKIIPSLTMTI